MAHDLMKNTMAFVGITPWHGLGIQVPPDVNANELIRKAGLDWRVEKIPAPGARVMKETGPIYDRYLIQREKRHDESEDVALGMVGAAYEPLQNSDAFKFFEPFIDSKFAQFHTAGALGNGERIWVLAKLNSQIMVAGDDAIDRYLLLANSHNGEGAVSVRFTPIRVVCQNTLNLAIKQGGKSAISIRHTRNIDRNLAKAQAVELKEIVIRVFEEAASSFGRMAIYKLGPENRERMLEALFPRTELQKQKNERPERWQRIEMILEDEKVTPKRTANTLWALYNAIVRDEDYRKSREAGSDARLERVWFGAGENLKLRTLEYCRNLISRKAA